MFFYYKTNKSKTQHLQTEEIKENYHCQMGKFPCLAYEKPVATNNNTNCCDICDCWKHINCINICKQSYR